jgi:hypothetical protein
VLVFFSVESVCARVSNAFQQRGYTTCRFTLSMVVRRFYHRQYGGLLVGDGCLYGCGQRFCQIEMVANAARKIMLVVVTSNSVAVTQVHESRDSKGCSVGSHVRSLGWLCWGCVEGGRLRPSSMKPIRNENTRYIFIFQARIFASSFTLLCAVCTVLYVCMYVCMC